MIIYKEVEVIHPLYQVKLDNGTLLTVYEDRIESSDGEEYKCVEEELGYDEFKVVGWYKVKDEVIR